jgi:Ca-activated chloride channel family protein
MINTPLSSAVAAARDFVAGVRFAHAGLFWLAVVPVALAVLAVVTRRRRRATLAAVGLPTAVAGLVVRPSRAGRLATLLLAVAWVPVVVGAAGPHWGTGDPDGVAVGRDVVVVLDLSRSMLADDTATGQARWQSAVAGAADLIDALRYSGGHRAALVAFAARPTLLVPLTTDTDHLRAKLAEIDAANPVPDIRPGVDDPASGTRIGLALLAAVAAHDPRFPGSRDIILVSDGDDPAGDREWVKGVSAAREAGIPVHAVGVGDPDRTSPVFVDGQPLEAEGPTGLRDWVRTRLREGVLTEIATEGRGAYLPARRDVPALAEFYRAVVEPNPARELTDDASPRPKDRSAWFLAAGAVLLFLGRWRER